MPSPSIVFSFIVATLYGSGFHFLIGGDARRLALCLLGAWVGFALGQIIGDLLEINAMNIGPTHFFPATLGTLLALSMIWLLTRREPDVYW